MYRWVSILLIFFSMRAAHALASSNFEPLKNPHARLMIFSPHPDDDVLGAAAVMKEAMMMKANGADVDVRVVYVTCGEGFAIDDGHPKTPFEIGEVRRKEALAALADIGVKEGQAVFLGFPDQGIIRIFSDFQMPSQPYTSPMFMSAVVPFSFALHPGQAFTRENLLADIREVIQNFRPTAVFTPTLTDEHPDHYGTSQFVAEVLQSSGLKIDHYEYLIHWDQIEGSWPEKTKESLEPKNHIKSDLRLALSDFAWTVEDKRKVIGFYQSQIINSNSYLFNFAKTSEQFWIHRPEIGDYLTTTAHSN